MVGKTIKKNKKIIITKVRIVRGNEDVIRKGPFRGLGNVLFLSTWW